MNRRAQSVITVIFWVGIFILLWALVFGDWLATFGGQSIATNSLTGIEAWFWGNLNLVVFVALIIAIMAYSYFGANS